MERPGRGNCRTSCCINSKRLQTDWKMRHHFKHSMTGGNGGGSAEVASPDDQWRAGGWTTAVFSLIRKKETVTIFVNLRVPGASGLHEPAGGGNGTWNKSPRLGINGLTSPKARLYPQG
jgi:hypothetical protein